MDVHDFLAGEQFRPRESVKFHNVNIRIFEMITNPRMPAPASGREIIACRSRGIQRLQVQRTFPVHPPWNDRLRLLEKTIAPTDSCRGDHEVPSRIELL